MGKTLFSIKVPDFDGYKSHYWRVESKDLSRRKDKLYGLCDHKNRVIYLNSRIKNQEILASTLRHELIHAIFPWMEEYSVCNLESLLNAGDKLLTDRCKK